MVHVFVFFPLHLGFHRLFKRGHFSKLGFMIAHHFVRETGWRVHDGLKLHFIMFSAKHEFSPRAVHLK